MSYKIHFVGERIESGSDSTVRLAACKEADERFVAITAEIGQVNCAACMKHGLFLHAMHNRSDGAKGTFSKRFSTKYDQLLALSQSEIAHLDYYGYWHWIKAMSMVRLWLENDFDVDSIERDASLWARVLELIQAGEFRALKYVAPKYKWKVDSVAFDQCATAISDVNKYRRAGYRFPEYGTARILPKKGEMLQVAEQSPGDVDHLINFANAQSKLQNDTVTEEIRSSAVSFEVACIFAEALFSGHSQRVLTSDLDDSRFALHPSTLVALGKMVDSNSERKVTIVFGENAASSSRKIHDLLFALDWLDPNVIEMAVEVAEETYARRKQCQKLADQLTAQSDEQQQLRKSASAYIKPKGILVWGAYGLDRIPYSDLFELLKEEQDFLSKVPMPTVLQVRSGQLLGK